MKLSAAQTKALQKINDNPGRIVVFTNNPSLSHDKRVHATTASNLHRKGLIEAYNPENGRSYDEDTDGSDIAPWYSGRYFWRLTDTGRASIGIETVVYEEDLSGVATDLGRTVGLGHSPMDSLRDMLKLY